MSSNLTVSASPRVERFPRGANARVLERMAIAAKELQPDALAKLDDVAADPLLTPESVAIPRDPVHVIDLEVIDDATARAASAERFDEHRAEQIDPLAPETEIAPTRSGLP